MGTIIGTSCGGEDVFRYIMKASGKKCPKFLYLPADGYSWNDIMGAYYLFGKNFDCDFDYLAILDKEVTQEIIKDKILSADIIFVGGGSAFDMTQMWNYFGLEKYFKEAHDNGTVLSGLSAGAIGWFKYGNGDSNFIKENGKYKYRKVIGTGLVNAICYPHYHEGNDNLFIKIMNFYTVPAIALEDGASIVIRDDKYKILSNRNKVVHRFENINGIIYKKIIDNQNFLSLKSLLG